MIDYFQAALSFLWRPGNDGQPFHVTARDPGGATSWGVTFATWSGWRAMHREPATMAVFRQLGAADFQPLYRFLFWQAVRCDQMGPLGIQVFDAAVLSGPSRSARFLQHVLGVTVDGIVGPETLGAFQAADPTKLNAAFTAERESFYAGEPDAATFGRGWNKRADACRDYVLSFLQGLPSA